MRLSEYSDDELIDEIVHRGIDVRVKINQVDLTITMGGNELGVINAK